MGHGRWGGEGGDWEFQKDVKGVIRTGIRGSGRIKGGRWKT